MVNTERTEYRFKCLDCGSRKKILDINGKEPFKPFCRFGHGSMNLISTKKKK